MIQFSNMKKTDLSQIYDDREFLLYEWSSVIKPTKLQNNAGICRALN